MTIKLKSAGGAFLSAFAITLAFALAFSACSKPAASQTECPVTGEKFDGKTFVDFQGQRIYLADASAREKFLQDADRYFGNIERQQVILENIQTACPHCGMSLANRKHFSDFKGRRVYFCSEGCKSDFGKDPLAMLGKLPGQKALPKPPKEHSHDHHHGEEDEEE